MVSYPAAWEWFLSMHPLDERTIDERRTRLLAWYDEQARDLPWRRDPTLYGTWIAESMLQQTTVRAVVPRWRRFLDRFPDVAALAAADEADVLAAWSGLGYYRRARWLSQAARVVMADHGGRLPDSLAGWLAMPGVGDYAAGAIASIGLGLPVAAVDANVRRVMMRWHCAAPREVGGLTRAAIASLAQEHVVPTRPGDWNQALMDLGAGPCRAGQPDCAACPVASTCAAGRAGTATQVPPPRERAETLAVSTSCLVLRCRDRILLLPSGQATVATIAGAGRPLRRDLSGLFAGMLALPSTPWYPEAFVGADPVPAAAATWHGWLADRSGSEVDVAVAGSFRHAITVHRLKVVVMVADWPATAATPELAGAVWADIPGHPQPLATLARRALQLAARGQETSAKNDL